MKTTIHWKKREILQEEESRIIRKFEETVFIKAGEWVISYPSTDVSTIWLH
jgi:hypothetical protein